MINIFTKNKYLELAVEGLLFLMAINFLHYGQLFLPVIALLLFIDNKFKIKQPIVLIISILFGLSFFVFAGNMGFYRVMGFCLPFAVYIGSCINITDDKAIKKLIYLIGFAMAFHVILNFAWEVAIPMDWDIKRVFNKPTHFDVWTKNHIKTTGTAMNMVIFLICLPQLLKEKKLSSKIISIIILVTLMVYNVALGKRMVYILALLAVIAYYLLDVIILKSRKISTRNIMIVLISLLAFVGLLFVAWNFNILGFSDLTIVRKFVAAGLKTERIAIYSWGFPLLSKHLWGGQEISKIIGIQFHDLFFDIYDCAGIISFILIILLYVCQFKKAFKAFKGTNKYKALIGTFLFISTLTMFIEPVITGESIYLICVVLINSAISAYKN